MPYFPGHLQKHRTVCSAASCLTEPFIYDRYNQVPYDAPYCRYCSSKPPFYCQERYGESSRYPSSSSMYFDRSSVPYYANSAFTYYPPFNTQSYPRENEFAFQSSEAPAATLNQHQEFKFNPSQEHSDYVHPREQYFYGTPREIPNCSSYEESTADESFINVQESESETEEHPPENLSSEPRMEYLTNNKLTRVHEPANEGDSMNIQTDDDQDPNALQIFVRALTK